MHILVIGASGRIGRRVVQLGHKRGHRVTAQTRSRGNVDESDDVRVVVGSPTNEQFLRRVVAGQDAVVFVLGVDRTGKTTLFSDATRALIRAMAAAGVRRLVALTGVGAGETRGHGGWFYNRVTFPLFTRNRYRDKDRQEALIEASELEWTIVRPAPFSETRPATPLGIFDVVPPDLQLGSVHPEEVANFILDELEEPRHVRMKPFIGR